VLPGQQSALKTQRFIPADVVCKAEITKNKYMTIITPSYLLTILTAIVPQLVIFSASIMYIIKLRRIDSLLLFIGSFIGILVTGFQFIIKPFVQTENPLDSIELDIRIMNYIGPISFLGSLAFCVGFLLLIIYSGKKNK
jgi:hypothetical protein